MKILKKLMAPLAAMLLVAGTASAQTVIAPDFRLDNHPAGFWSGQPVVQSSLNGGQFLTGWAFSDGFFTHIKYCCKLDRTMPHASARLPYKW